MRILFRAEAKPEIGLGHLIRSLYIAKTIRESYLDVNITFLCGNYKLSIEKIIEQGFDYQTPSGKSEENFLLDSVNDFKSDVLFIDKLYNYSNYFILKLKEHLKIVMFHNLCDSAHLCDAFIFPAAHIDDQILNQPRWKTKSLSFYEGFDYIVLNEKIINLKKRSIDKSNIRSIVVTTGGSDPNGVMIKVLKWLNHIYIPDISINALIGESFVHKHELERIKKDLKSNIKTFDYDVKHFNQADIAISTFGVSTYELLYLGFNVISIGHCERNANGSKNLSLKCNQLIDLGNIEYLTEADFHAGVYHSIKEWEKPAFTNCHIDGKGVNRVANIIYNLGKRHNYANKNQ